MSEGSGLTFFNSWKRIVNLEYYAQQEYSPEMKRKIKTFSDEGKLKESFTSRPKIMNKENSLNRK